MRDSIKKAIGETVQDMIDSGFKTSFTEKELNALDITIPEVQLTTHQIKGIREKIKFESNRFCQIIKRKPIFNKAMGTRKKKANGFHTSSPRSARKISTCS